MAKTKKTVSSSCVSEGMDLTAAANLPLGMELKLRLPNEVLIDWDHPSGSLNEQALDILSQVYGEYKTAVSVSQSGNLHFTLTFGSELTTIEAVAVQAILGSDPIREAMALLRTYKGVDNPIAFYENKVDVEEEMQLCLV